MPDDATGAHAEIVRDLEGDSRKPPRKGRKGLVNEDEDPAQVRYELFLDPVGNRIRGVQLDVYGSPAVLATAAAVGALAMHATVAEARRRLRLRGGARRPSPPLEREDRELSCCLRAMRAALRSATDAAARLRTDAGGAPRLGVPLGETQPTAG